MDWFVSSPPPPSPTSLNDFELISTLGKGAFGTVYRVRFRAEELQEQPDLALKVLSRKRVHQTPEAVVQLRDEATLLRRLSHRAIVRVHGVFELDAGTDAAAWAMLMELVSGVSLRQLKRALAKARRLLPMPAVLLVTSEIAAALDHATHAANSQGEALWLVHRDIKPANVIITAEGGVKVLDFGLAWATEREADPTRTGVIKGSVPYMAPEQLRSEPVDVRADLYSLGIIFYELLAGQRYHPSRGPTVRNLRDLVNVVARTRFSDKEGLLRAVLLDPLGRDLATPEALDIEQIVRWMLQHDREQRPPDAGVVLDRLAALQRTWPGEAGERQLKRLHRSNRAASSPQAAWSSKKTLEAPK